MTRHTTRRFRSDRGRISATGALWALAGVMFALTLITGSMQDFVHAATTGEQRPGSDHFALYGNNNSDQ